MFTGIIEGMGTVRTLKTSGQGKRLTIAADFALGDDTKVGDSIAVNGACLTVVAVADTRFTVDISPETVNRTTLGTARMNDRVNLERALRFNGRIDGHLVAGHIDGTGVLIAKAQRDNATVLKIGVSNELLRYMIPRGSVAIDGVSLTINRLTQKDFEITVIPHTGRMTTIGMKQIGQKFNIETDIIGKYVERLITLPPNSNGQDQAPTPSIDMAFLTKTGFI